MRKIKKINLHKEKIKCFVLITLMGFFCVITPFTFSRSAVEGEANNDEEIEQNQSASTTSQNINTVTNNPNLAEAASTRTVGTSASIANNIFQESLSGATLDATVSQQYQGSQTAFPNGKDCVYVNIEAYNANGAMLENQPLVIEKPDPIAINGPTDTQSGSITWCVVSSQPVQATITVKLRNYASIQQTFTVDYTPDFDISDYTSGNSFLYGAPITFQAKIVPAMARGLSSAKLIYTHYSCYYGGCPTTDGSFTKAIIYTVDLSCSSNGVCSATVPASETSAEAVANGFITYTYQFATQTGDNFQEAFSGTLYAN